MPPARTVGGTGTLRASELVALRWDDINLQAGKLHVRRSKDGETSVHPLCARELRALRRLQRETPEGQRSVHVFVSERLAPLSVSGYQRMVARAGEAAKFPFLISSHVLRHSCGYKLANDGQDTRAIQHYLGHRAHCAPRPSDTRSRCCDPQSSLARAAAAGMRWSREPKRTALTNPRGR
jgi:site-specific recombinase XerD